MHLHFALSVSQKKWVHTAAVGFGAGVLSYASGLVIGQPMPFRAVLLALLVAGVSRAAGALLAKAP